MPASVSKVKVGDAALRLRLTGSRKSARAILLANGAGANMDSDFQRYFAEELAARDFLVANFNFLYQEQGRKAPDRAPLLEATYLAVLAALAKKTGLAPGKIALGGKSMGGRIASQCAARTEAKALVYLGYPLHAPGRQDKLRDEHLYAIKAKQLFLSGERDPFADQKLLRGVLKKVKGAKLVVVPGGDHSFKVTKKSGLDQDKVLADCVSEIVRFVK